MASTTHPDYAALIGPLFAYGGKRAWEMFALRIVAGTGS